MVHVEKKDGKWGINDPASGRFIECETNAAAWRLADKLNNEAMNRQEHVHDWSATSTR